MTILDKKIQNCANYKDFRTWKKFTVIKQLTDKMVRKTDERMLKAIKEVYVYRNVSVIGAAQSILFLSQTQAYVHIRGWFEEYENCLFDKIFLDEMY